MASPKKGSSEAVKVVQGIPSEALSSIAKRLLRRLGDRSHKQLLTAEEEKQACSTLQVSTKDLEALVEFSAYIFEQAAYQMQQPDHFEDILAATHGVDKERAAALRKVWEAEATGYVNRLRDQHILGRNVLRDTTYTTQLCVAESDAEGNQGKGTESTAIFEFHIGPDQTDNLAVECSHQELYGFFQKLQDIQRTIDNLSA